MNQQLSAISPKQAYKRILMTADTIGGVWNYAIELADGLGRSGILVALATMGAPLTRSQRNAASQLDNLLVFESNFRLEWMQDPWSEVDRAGGWLLALEQQIQPDIVHLNGYSHGALPWRAPVLIVAHSCVLSWWEAVKGDKAPSDWNEYRARVKAGLECADAVVAPTRHMLNSLRTHYSWLKRGHVVPNGRDAQQFTPSCKEPFVLCAGRFWDEAKNLHTIERAASRLRWPVYAAGDGRHPDGGIASSDSICMLGQLSNEHMTCWLKHAAIFASPAKYEPFGLAILEAALSGCALILGDIPSLREIWADTACYVPPDDPEAFVAVVDELVSDVRFREKIGLNARQRALEFSCQRMLDGYASIYAFLANGADTLQTGARF
jgi:glycogen synthase